MTDLFSELRENVRTELIGLVCTVIGALFFLSLRVGEGTPGLVVLLGWTAPLFAIGLMVLGVVLMLGRRAGYWSAEALVGGELLLLSLQAGTFAWYNDETLALRLTDGSFGGLVGQILGGFLVDLLGRWPTLLLLTLLGLLGCAMLLRYTPCIYAVAYLVRAFPALRVAWTRLLRVLPGQEPNTDQREPDPLPPIEDAENYVVAIDEPDKPIMDADVAQSAGGQRDEPTPASNSSTGSATTATKNRSGKKAKKRPKPMRKVDELPSIDLLAPDLGDYGSADVRALEQLIEQTLTDFNVPVKVVHVESGPTVTQFGVEPLYLERAGQKRKVRVSRIVNLADDLALALAAPAVRIEAPVPGRPYVGIEVPNPDKTYVGLRGVMESKAMRRADAILALALGRDTSGQPVVMDLTRAPHMLIAGATGSGKSVCINSIITSLLMQHGPESLRFVMVDPKMVELPGYNGIPHLLGKVITDMEHVMGALTWLLLQMDDRYQLFREVGVRNIEAYNAVARRRKALEPLPYIVLIVDELADLMMTAADDIERQICRLAQMARATGIHLILATQRPSTDVVTGLIKANFPSRIAFAVTSQIDSRVILDTPGAEKLLGLGDMLLMRSDTSKLFRLQGVWVADEEIEAVARFWKEAGADDEQTSRAVPPPWNALMDRLDEEDELMLDAIDILREVETCNTSMLQRRLRIGYPKAARMMEELEAKGVVGPDLGGGQGRKVLLKHEEELNEEDLDDEDDLS